MTDLDAIEARAAAATPGPWRRDDYDDSYLAADLAPWRDGDYCKLFWDSEGDGLSWPNPADADFVVHARSDIPALLARIRALEAREAALREDVALAFDALGGMWSWSESNGYFLGGAGWVLEAGQLLRAIVGRPAARPGPDYAERLDAARALLSDAPVAEETPQ